ncbi:MAG: endonuclease/exonuclease/phosphatase family protein [Myxococcales bacterium]|nr:endonuclease/exonuclease/phosphatase family protein [Myxococcales bacterium]
MTGFRLCTLNVERTNRDFDRVTAALIGVDADVVCLQENTAEWDAALARSLAERYRWRSLRPTGGPGGMALWSRRRVLVEKKLIPPTGGWFGAWYHELAIGDGSLHLINVHLRPPYLERGGRLSVPFAWFTTFLARFREVRSMRRIVGERRPLVVCGDFNEPWGLARGFLRRAWSLESALDRHTPDVATWSERVGPLNLALRLDDIYHSAELRCRSAEVLMDCGSDHRPVVAEFVL